jgi:O-antigen/teichoic acid export membrane protein
MKAEKSIIGEVSGVFTSNIVTVVIGFASAVILSRVLGPELKGIYASLLVVPGMIASFAALGTRQSSIYHIGKKIFTNSQVIAALFYLFLVGSVVGILLFLAYSWFNSNDDFTTMMIVLAMLYLPVKLLITYSGSIFLANLQFRKSNMLKWLTALLTLAGIFVLVFVLRMSVTGALIALISASVIVLIIAIVNIVRQHEIKLRFDSQVIAKLFQMGIAYALALFIIQLNFRVDILILQFLSDNKEIGYYSVGVSIAEKLMQIPFAIGVVVISRSANSINLSLLTKEVSRMMRLGFLLVLIASVVLYVIVPYVVPLVYGHAFSRSAVVVQQILPGIIFFVIARVLSSSLAGMGKPLVIIFIFLPALLLNIILNFLWIPDYGCIGAAWATNVSYISGSIVLLIIYSRITRTSLLSMITFRKDDFHIIRNLREIRKQKKQVKNSFEEDNTNDE